MSNKKGAATKIVIGTLLVVIVCMGGYIVHLTGAEKELPVADAPTANDTIADGSAAVEDETVEPIETEPVVSSSAMTDAELEAVFEKVYTGCADAPIADALFNLSEVLDLQNKTYPSDYADKYLAWADEKAMAETQAMKDQLAQWANGENLDMMAQEGSYVAPDSEAVDLSTPTEHNYTNSDNVTTDPDDEINNNFQQSGVDTFYTETEDTGTVPDLSIFGGGSAPGQSFDPIAEGSVGDLDDTGLIINP